MAGMFKRYMEKLEAAKGDQLLGFSQSETAEAIVLLLRQMILADCIEREEEIVAAMNIVHTFIDAELPLGEDFGEAFSLEKAKKMIKDTGSESIFPLCRILFASLDRDKIIALRKKLEQIALADGHLHPYEEDFLELYDQLTSDGDIPAN